MDRTMLAVIIALILGVILIIMSASGAFNSFKDFFSNPFVKSDYSSLSSSTRAQEEMNFDVFVNNLQACRNTVTQSCICRDVFVNFPYTFLDDISVKIAHKKDGDVVSMMYGKQEIKNITLSNTFISSVSFVDGNVIETTQTPYENMITSAKGVVSFDNDKVISSGIYKHSKTRMEIPIYNYKSGSLFKPASEEKQIAAVSALAKC
jgi:hypothetical protein